MKLEKICLVSCTVCSIVCTIFLCIAAISYKNNTLNNAYQNQVEEIIEDSSIVSSLEKINSTLNTNNYFDYIFPWILTTITSLIAYFASYFITKKTNSKNYQRECTYDYLKYLNSFLRDIIHIHQNMINISKLTKTIYIRNFITLNASIVKYDDYQNFVTTIKSIKSVVNNNTLMIDQRLKDNWNKCYEELENFNVFINIGQDFESNVVHYFYILDKEIVSNHVALINLLAKYTQQSLSKFNIIEYEELIKQHVKRTNEIAMNKKLDYIR